MYVTLGILTDEPAYEELSWIEEEWRMGRMSTALALRCARQAINRKRETARGRGH